VSIVDPAVLFVVDPAGVVGVFVPACVHLGVLDPAGVFLAVVLVGFVFGVVSAAVRVRVRVCWPGELAGSRVLLLVFGFVFVLVFDFVFVFNFVLVLVFGFVLVLVLVFVFGFVLVLIVVVAGVFRRPLRLRGCRWPGGWPCIWSG